MQFRNVPNDPPPMRQTAGQEERDPRTTAGAYGEMREL